MRLDFLIVIMTLSVILLSCANKSKLPPCMQKGWSKEKVIEGVVWGYKPMDKAGHGSMEVFFVDSIPFAYSDYKITGFYNNSCVKGGLICENGQKVRIIYKTQCDVINGIVNIEILNELKNDLSGKPKPY